MLNNNGTALANAKFETSPTAEDGTWEDYSFGTTIPLTAGKKLYFRAKTDNSGIARSKSNYLVFGMTNTYGVSVSGNIMTLLSPNFEELNTVPTYAFYKMFNNTGITSCNGLKFPAEILSPDCYEEMFNNCKSLIDGTATIDAVELASSCCYKMFYNCSNMVTGPEKILATVMKGDYCLGEMFNICKALKVAPTFTIDAIESDADGCCNKMFAQCTNLESADITLNASELVDSCYDSMFSNCGKLAKIPSLSNVTVLGPYCMNSMFSSCSSVKISENESEGDIILNLPAGSIVPSKALNYMFNGTGGSFKGTPSVGKTYRAY